MPIGEFQELLHEFLRGQQYKQLGWQVDKGVRDTGPFIRNWNYALMIGTLYQGRKESNLKNPKVEVSHFIKLANDPEFADIPRGLLVNWQQARPHLTGGEKTRPNVVQATHPDSYYYRDKKGKQLTKRLMVSMAAPALEVQ